MLTSPAGVTFAAHLLAWTKLASNAKASRLVKLQIMLSEGS